MADKKLVSVLERILERLDAIDEHIAQHAEHLTQLRESAHGVRNNLQTIVSSVDALATVVDQLQLATSVDLDEIRKVQQHIAKISDSIAEHHTENRNVQTQLNARIRTLETGGRIGQR